MTPLDRLPYTYVTASSASAFNVAKHMLASFGPKLAGICLAALKAEAAEAGAGMLPVCVCVGGASKVKGGSSKWQGCIVCGVLGRVAASGGERAATLM